jgi:hypothetical protein
MKKCTLWISLISLVVVSGCTNVRFVEPREGCRRGVGVFVWDICEDVNDPVPTPRLKIEGDEDLIGSEEETYQATVEEDVKITYPESVEEEAEETYLEAVEEEAEETYLVPVEAE